MIMTDLRRGGPCVIPILWGFVVFAMMRFMLSYLDPFFSWFSVMFGIVITSLQEERLYLVYMILVHINVYSCIRYVLSFSLPLGVEVGCGLWHSLNFSFNFYHV